MRRAESFRGCCFAVSMNLLIAACVVYAQAPSSIQIFMPGGALPGREIRFTLTRDDGRIEILFTDTKGKFPLTGDLARERDYRITVETDRRTYDTTTVSFRLLRGGGVTYIPVFLRPYEGETVPRAGVVDISSLDGATPRAARVAYEQALEAINKGQAEEAIGKFKSALALHPDYLRALNDLGVLYLKLNRLDEAAETFNRALKLNKRFAYPRLNLGLVLNKQGKHKEAATLLRRLYEENPSLAGLASALAEALTGAGKLPEAKKILTAALSEPGLERIQQVDLRFRLGMALSREEHYAEAVAELERVVALEPDAVNAHLLLGGSLLQLKRLAEAERELRRAYELGGKDAGTAQLLLGQLYFMQGRFETAMRAFEQYLKDVPNAPNAGAVKETIEKIRLKLKKA